mmetsp:Transcript_19521/g.22401  ORF Transcript_19521/g.22401 Transcript_19521/m.22401 type:complete len:286 (+) Transcript_19521:55-912(+)
MQHCFATILDREIHFTQWGSAVENKPSVVCWHGLARTCRDFDILAEALHTSLGLHVICPDTIGRGFSEWSPKPEEEYTIPHLALMAKGLLDSLNIKNVYWFGTSMGGMIGYIGGATVLRPYMRRLILNDIGPTICPDAIARIIATFEKPLLVDTMMEMEAKYTPYYKNNFGIQDDAYIRFLVQAGSRRTPEGKWTSHFDPKIVDMLRTKFNTGTDDMDDPWTLYDSLSCPVLTIRGANSDLLSEASLQKMAASGPKCKTVVFQNVGHAPAMNTPEQIDVVMKFFS